LSNKSLNGVKVKKMEKGSGIRMATGRVNNRELEERTEGKKVRVVKKAGRRKKECR
jgi:hypothetical protein